jgi:hypothetical protein
MLDYSDFFTEHAAARLNVVLGHLVNTRVVTIRVHNNIKPKNMQ